MKTRYFFIIFLLSLVLCGCASSPHVIGYDIIKTPLPPPNLGKVCILPFDDQRPEQEHKGVKGKLLIFSSKDSHFNKEVSEAITETLSEELTNLGLSPVKDITACDYTISGSVKHFQAIISPAKITFLPYLGSVSTLWAKDEFTIALSIYIEMTDTRQRTLIDKTFDLSEDMKLPTGLLNLARYSRGFDYKLKLLDEALKDVMGQICDEIVAKAKR